VIVLEDNMLDFDSSFNGNVRNSLWFSKDMAEIAKWTTGVMSISYADAIRTYSYINTTDTLLTMFVHVHPGQSFHIAVAWTVAWNLLTGLIDSCDAVPEEPRLPLPMLTSELITSEIETTWRKQSHERLVQCSSSQKFSKRICLYHWIASKLQAATKEAISSAMAKVLSNNTGWTAYGFPVRKPRRTWLGQGRNASFTIQIKDIATPIDRMMVLYIKSYGKAWESSRLLLLVEGKQMGDTDWKELHRFELEGTHKAQTSINYSHNVNFEHSLSEGSNIRAVFTIMNGERFQINGLALCGLSNETAVNQTALN
jgi:hypothetical protein